MVFGDVAHAEQFIDEPIQKHLGFGPLAEHHELISPNYVDNVVKSADDPTFFYRLFLTLEEGNIASDFDTIGMFTEKVFGMFVGVVPRDTGNHNTRIADVNLVVSLLQKGRPGSKAVWWIAPDKIADPIPS